MESFRYFHISVAFVTVGVFVDVKINRAWNIMNYSFVILNISFWSYLSLYILIYILFHFYNWPSYIIIILIFGWWYYIPDQSKGVPYSP